MKKILFCSYRDWSNKICDKIQKYFSNKDVVFINCNNQNKFLNLIDEYGKFDIIFFLGWSNIISKNIVEKYKCVCLHPSLLPKYRGGSPLQHQIINGESIGGISLFLMDEFLDTGPIICQNSFNIKNLALKDIYDKIIENGIIGIIYIINCILEEKQFTLHFQNNQMSTYFKRRTPQMSEIKIEDFEKYTAEELHNKIRALQDPYPNAFIKCKNNTILLIQESEYINNETT